MKKTLSVLLALAAVVSSMAQSFYFLEAGKTLQTDYKVPLAALGYGYRFGVMTIEGGLKTNFQECYSLFYTAGGIQTNGRLFAGTSGGIGITANIPQQDRGYYPETGETIIEQKGYTTKTITTMYANVKAGYRFGRVIPYASFTHSWKNYVTAGIRLCYTY